MTGAKSYTLPLSTLLTPEEAGLMRPSIMGQAFHSKTIQTPDGTLLMFNSEGVRQWAEERIAKLRAITPIEEGKCERCGGTEGLREMPDTEEVFCASCAAWAERNEFRYCYLETALAQAVALYLQAFKGETQVRDLLNGANTILHHLVLDHIKSELNGKDN